jgi:hypothetical protein
MSSPASGSNERASRTWSRGSKGSVRPVAKRFGSPSVVEMTVGEHDPGDAATLATRRQHPLDVLLV